MLLETFHIFNSLATDNYLLYLNWSAEFYSEISKGDHMLFYSCISSTTIQYTGTAPPFPPPISTPIPPNFSLSLEAV
jgi:hypothetical protein